MKIYKKTIRVKVQRILGLSSGSNESVAASGGGQLACTWIMKKLIVS